LHQQSPILLLPAGALLRALHGSHEARAVVAYASAAQGAQESVTARTTVEAVPSAQREHCCEPALVLYLPATQPAQA